jgi:hypothetical protein
MRDLRAHDRATQIAGEFLQTEFDDKNKARRWLVEHVTAAIRDAETSERDVHRPGDRLRWVKF